jgi:hypothetical protein
MRQKETSQYGLLLLTHPTPSPKPQAVPHDQPPCMVDHHVWIVHSVDDPSSRNQDG